MPRRFNRKSLAFSRRHRNIKIDRVGRNSIHRPLLTPKTAADNPHMRAVVVGQLGDFAGFHFLISRCGHLQRRGQVRPKLKPMHPARRVAFRHFLMDDAAARGHPLHVARGDGSVISHAVTMFNGSGQHICDCLDPAMRVPREARQIVFRNIVPKIIEQQKWIELMRAAKAERAAQMYTGTFQRGLRFDKTLYWANRHKRYPFAIKKNLQYCCSQAKDIDASRRRFDAGATSLRFFRTPILIFLLACLGVAVGVDLLIHRGFRASTTPSVWESAIAGRVRNFAIPAVEANKPNPVALTADSLRGGRDLYVARCAACHGVDGSGHTPIGSNTYPRVPDLRSAKTQRLTDGQLHYIIENGVQLTGMPAWSNTGSASDPWILVWFVRSLRCPNPNHYADQGKMLASAHYTGSQACEKCHQEIYVRWKKTPMANVVRDPLEHPDAIIPDLNTNRIAPFTKDQVAFVYGSLWKQRYFTRVGDDYFPLSAQWDVGNRSWRPYKVAKGTDWWTAFYPDDNMQRPTGPTCDGCHSVNYDIHSRQVTEWNVGCERCHGPGSEHVVHPTKENILNPGQMESVAASDTCIQCHSQGQPVSSPIEGKYYDWPVGYNVGLKLADFWKLEDCTLGQTTFYYFADCTAHKNRMQGNDFSQSVMYRRGITCAACHDVHGTGNYAQLRKPANVLCLDCHGPSSPNGPRAATLEEHTHHKAGSSGSDCITCHMPAIESEGVPGAFVHAHTFRFISPEMTDKYAVPNPCTSCHKEKTTAWAKGEMRHWLGHSRWEIAP